MLGGLSAPPRPGKLAMAAAPVSWRPAAAPGRPGALDAVVQVMPRRMAPGAGEPAAPLALPGHGGGGGASAAAESGAKLTQTAGPSEVARHQVALFLRCLAARRTWRGRPKPPAGRSIDPAVPAAALRHLCFCASCPPPAIPCCDLVCAVLLLHNVAAATCAPVHPCLARWCCSCESQAAAEINKTNTAPKGIHVAREGASPPARQPAFQQIK